MESKFKRNEYRFGIRTDAKQGEFSFPFLKSIQEFSLLIQKKIFMKKLWAYYKLKHFEGNCSLFSYYTTRPTSISSYKSLQKSTFQTDSALTTQVSGTLKLGSPTNRITHKLQFNQFVKSYPLSDPREMIFLSNSLNTLVKSLSKFQEKIYFILKQFALNNLKIVKMRKKRFLSYRASLDCKRKARSIYNVMAKRKQSLILYSFRCIYEAQLVAQRHQGLKSLILLFKHILKRFMIESYRMIKYKSLHMKKVKNCKIMSERMHLLGKIKLTFAFYHVKSYAKKKGLIINRFLQCLQKKQLLAIRFAYQCINVYCRKYKNIEWAKLENKNNTPRIITLPTIFLHGDPESGISRKDYYRNLTSKTRLSFIF